jgi:hypothetical protein
MQIIFVMTLSTGMMCSVDGYFSIFIHPLCYNSYGDGVPWALFAYLQVPNDENNVHWHLSLSRKEETIFLANRKCYRGRFITIQKVVVADGGEWEPIKIPREELGIYPKIDPPPLSSNLSKTA